VLGFDSERSTDHDWGPRLLVFLEDEEAERVGVAVDEMLGRAGCRSCSAAIRWRSASPATQAAA